MTRKELLQAYRVSHKTFAKWIAVLGPEFRYIRVFSPLQLQRIYTHLGEP